MERLQVRDLPNIFSSLLLFEGHEATLIDLYQTPLPFYTPEDDGAGHQALTSFKQALLALRGLYLQRRNITVEFRVY